MYKRKGPKLSPEAEAWMVQQSLLNFVAFYEDELLLVHWHGKAPAGVPGSFVRVSRQLGLLVRTRGYHRPYSLTGKAKELLRLE